MQFKIIILLKIDFRITKYCIINFYKFSENSDVH